MAQIGLFPQSRFGLGSTFAFRKPTIGKWRIHEKVSQHNHQRTEDNLDYRPSSAEAKFLVEDESNTSGPLAYMRVYMQVPHPLTEFEPREIRRRQADLCPHSEVDALQFFHKQNATMVPALLGFKEELQDNDGIVPGGFIVYMVFQRVPGVRLADDHVGFNPGFPLPKFFQIFNRAERDKVREEFEKGYVRLARLNYKPFSPWATHLVWDAESSKL